MLEALTSLPLANLLFITLVVFVGIRFAGRGNSSTRAVSGALWVAGCAVGAWALLEWAGRDATRLVVLIVPLAVIALGAAMYVMRSRRRRGH
jgi:lipopolysaccharide export LptBFGC system permease protein LptF